MCIDITHGSQIRLIVMRPRLLICTAERDSCLWEFHGMPSMELNVKVQTIDIQRGKL